VVVRVVDRCPECQAGHFDLRRSSFAKVADLPDGRVAVRWRAVTCPTVGNLRLQVKDGSNPWWVAIQPRNHRRPVAKLEGKKDGVWKELQRADYNYFLEESGLGPGPVELRVTADDGTVVSATLQSVQPNTEVEAAGQF
jgi:expansin (peptidoglycan-binding protein)